MGQQVGGGGVPGAGGGSATLPTATAAGQDLRATGAGTTYAAQNATNQKELSCASDIGAQFNTAVTALSSVGRIILPNCTNAPMSTTANVPPGISVQGYGKLATIINCTVAGDCFKVTMNPTSVGEIAQEVSSFGITGSGASNQVLWHNSGASGQTMHDVQFEGYATGGAATCLEYSNDTSGQFTEGNRTFNVSLERTCTNGVYFYQNTADSSNSFGYNFFEFHVVAQGSNYGVTATASSAGSGTAFLYNGSLIIYGNHVGPGGGMLQFLNGFSTDSALGLPNERLYITAEENGSGAGVLINIPGTGSLLRFYGNVVNGAFNSSGSVLATTYNDPNNAFNLQTDVAIDKLGNYTMNGQLTLVGNVSNTSSLNFTPYALPGAEPTWGAFASNGANLLEFTQTGSNSVAGFPFLIYGAPFATNSAARGVAIPSDAVYQWDSTASGGTIDTGLSRSGANAVACGNGAQGNATCALSVGKINVLAARKGTFVCTAGGTITIANTNEAATSDVVISLNTAGGTIATPPAMKTVTAGTGFTVLCAAADTSTYNYDILN